VSKRIIYPKDARQYFFLFDYFWGTVPIRGLSCNGESARSKKSPKVGSYKAAHTHTLAFHTHTHTHTHTQHFLILTTNPGRHDP